MRSIIKYTFLAILCLNTCLAQGTIAVMELDALGISIDESKALTDRLRYELHSSGNFTVLERAMMDEILKEQGFQLSGCVSEACIVEAGRLLAVENIIGGSLSKVGSTYSVSIRFVSVETGKVLGSAQKDFSNKIDYLLTDGITIIVKDLITSLGAEQSRRLTTAKLPFQNYGSIIAESSLALKFFDTRSIFPGLGVDFGIYKNKNLFSLGITPYIVYDWHIVSANFKYRRFLTGLSIPLPTLKAVQIITPFVTTDIEIFKNWQYDFAWKFGFGIVTEISTFYSVYADFAFNIQTDSEYGGFFSNPVFKIGLLFSQFPRLW